MQNICYDAVFFTSSLNTVLSLLVFFGAFLSYTILEKPSRRGPQNSSFKRFAMVISWLNVRIKMPYLHIMHKKVEEKYATSFFGGIHATYDNNHYQHQALQTSLSQ